MRSKGGCQILAAEVTQRSGMLAGHIKDQVSLARELCTWNLKLESGCKLAAALATIPCKVIVEIQFRSYTGWTDGEGRSCTYGYYLQIRAVSPPK